MSDLENLNGVEGAELSDEQIRGILGQIDLDIMNLVRDGKLSALPYGTGGDAGQTADRAANLQALLTARNTYQQLLNARCAWIVSRGDCGCSGGRSHHG